MATSPSVRTDPFQAVGCAARRELLEALADGDKSVAELAGPFDMTRQAVSQHLQVLLAAELVRVTPSGRERRYSLELGPLERMHGWTERLLGVRDPSGHLWSFSRGATEPRSPKKRS